MPSAAGPTPRLCWELSPSRTCLRKHSNPSLPHSASQASCCWQGREFHGESHPIPSHRPWSQLSPAAPEGKECSLLSPGGGAGASLGGAVGAALSRTAGSPLLVFHPGSAAGFGAPESRSSREPARLQEKQASREFWRRLDPAGCSAVRMRG